MSRVTATVVWLVFGLGACGADAESTDPAPAAELRASSPESPEPSGSPEATRTGTFSDEQVDALAAQFAPHVHVHPDDPNRPANVDWYLERVTMRFHHAGCPDHEILPLGRVTQEALVTQTHNENRSLCRHDESVVRKSTESDSFFLEVIDPATYAGAPPNAWKTYVVTRPKEGLLEIEYWFFYPFNDGFSVFNHESDWEHVKLTFDTRGEPVEIRFAQHDGGTAFPWNDPRIEKEGTHPVAYSAIGTHASFPSEGTFDIEGTFGVAKDHTKKSAQVWKTEDALVAIGTRARPRNNQRFVAYRGRWGEVGDLPHATGIIRAFD
jgi:hypothetical protein